MISVISLDAELCYLHHPLWYAQIFNFHVIKESLLTNSLAWRVDFNLSLQSFETAIHGVRCLVDFSLESPLKIPPKIVFLSSVGVYHGNQILFISVSTKINTTNS